MDQKELSYFLDKLFDMEQAARDAEKRLIHKDDKVSLSAYRWLRLLRFLLGTAQEELDNHLTEE